MLTIRQKSDILKVIREELIQSALEEDDNSAKLLDNEESKFRALAYRRIIKQSFDNRGRMVFLK